METTMMDSGNKIKLMDLEFTKESKVEDMKVVGKMISPMDSESNSGVMETYIKENSNTDLKMEEVDTLGMTDHSMMDNGSKGKYKGKEDIVIMMEECMMVNGKII